MSPSEKMSSAFANKAPEGGFFFFWNEVIMLSIMPKKTLAILGIILVLTEISGATHNWKTGVAIAVGIIIVFLALKGAANEDGGGQENSNLPVEQKMGQDSNGKKADDEEVFDRKN